MTQVNFAVEMARETGQGRTGVLRVASVPSAAFELLPDILPRFRAAYPNVRFILTGDTTGRELAALRQGLIDLAIIVPPMTEQKGLDITLLKVERLCLAVPGDHHLAGLRRAKVSAIANDPLIAFSFTESPGYAAAVLNACQRAGFLPRVLQETSQMPTSLTLVAAGMGVALAPNPMRKVQIRNVVFLEVTSDDGEPLPYTLAFAARSDRRSAIVDAFLRIAREVTHELEPMPA
jgi:DNA-binding transcriptional LysR family regulator